AVLMVFVHEDHLIRRSALIEIPPAARIAICVASATTFLLDSSFDRMPAADSGASVRCDRGTVDMSFASRVLVGDVPGWYARKQIEVNIRGSLSRVRGRRLV